MFCEKYLKQSASIWCENMLRYDSGFELSLDVICSIKLTVFLELRSRETFCLSEQLMFVDKYLTIILFADGKVNIGD